MTSKPHYHFTRLNPKKRALSNFAFQHCKEFIGTQCKKNFSNPPRDSWGLHYQGTAIPALSEKLPKWHFLTPAWNFKFFGPNVFFWCTVKVSFSDFFPKVSQAPSKCFSKWINWIISRIPRWIWIILFVLSSYEFLAMLEGKIWKCPFF